MCILTGCVSVGWIQLAYMVHRLNIFYVVTNICVPGGEKICLTT
jgi:hypothetical protein